MGSVVLVTGVSRYLGGLLARRLSADPTVDRVVGVDVIPPAASAASSSCAPTSATR